jgi:diamine N-acetyltransferase
MFEIYQLIEEQRAVRESGQLRLIIQEKSSSLAIGAVDIYNIDFKNCFGTVGILVAEEQYRKKGYASESLMLLAQYAREYLQLNNLTCGIQSSNISSQRLFEKCNYLKIGTRNDWFLVDGKREDEYIYQLIL